MPRCLELHKHAVEFLTAPSGATRHAVAAGLGSHHEALQQHSEVSFAVGRRKHVVSSCKSFSHQFACVICC